MTAERERPEQDAAAAARDLGQPETDQDSAQDRAIDDHARAQVEGGAKPGEPRPDAPPAAGAHASPELTNPDATPGAGALNPSGGHDGDVDATSG